jgi:hypothetical protein
MTTENSLPELVGKMLENQRVLNECVRIQTLETVQSRISDILRKPFTEAMNNKDTKTAGLLLDIWDEINAVFKTQ